MVCANYIECMYTIYETIKILNMKFWKGTNFLVLKDQLNIFLVNSIHLYNLLMLYPYPFNQGLRQRQNTKRGMF